MSIEVNVSVDWLKQVHRDLDACQKVIWLAGCRPQVPNGFDPSYVTDAQARLKEIEARIATATAPGQPAAHKPQTCNGKRCGWCKEGAEPCHYAGLVFSAEQQGVALSREACVIALRLIHRELETLANGSAIERFKAAKEEFSAMLAAAPAPSTTEGQP